MDKFYEKYMLFVGTGGSLVFYLQAFKIFYERSATDVSLAAFVAGLISVASWMIYGLMIKNRVLFISNVLATIGALIVVIGILSFS